MDAFPELVAPYEAVAADLAATWFELSAPESSYIAVTAPPVPVEKLATSAEWALGAPGDEAVNRLEGTLQRAVNDGARETTLLNVERTNSRWARYASANACAFCRLVATRGAVYRSSDTAGKAYHDHCHCVAVEVREGQTYSPPEYVQAWEDEYIAARKAAGSGDPKQILSAWRQQGVK